MNQIDEKVHTAIEVRSGLVQKGRVWVTRKGVKVDRIGMAGPAVH